MPINIQPSIRNTVWSKQPSHHRNTITISITIHQEHNVIKTTFSSRVLFQRQKPMMPIDSWMTKGGILIITEGQRLNLKLVYWAEIRGRMTADQRLSVFEREAFAKIYLFFHRIHWPLDIKTSSEMEVVPQCFVGGLGMGWIFCVLPISSVNIALFWSHIEETRIMITLENKSQKGTEYKQTEELLGDAWRTPRCCLEVDSLGGAWRTTLEGGLATPAQSLLRHRRGGSGVQCH